MTIMAERPTVLRTRRADTEPEPVTPEPTPTEPTPAAIRTKNVMHILDDTGDSTISWNPTNTAEVEAAEAHFAKMKSAGHLAYRTDANGGQAEQMRAFDSQAERIAFVPQLQGG